MKKSIPFCTIVVLLICCVAATAWAENATKEEVIAKCQAAAKIAQDKGVE